MDKSCDRWKVIFKSFQDENNRINKREWTM